MVVLSLRNRQNRECVDEDLRANKKVFERTQQQIAIMPQSEMPPNDKLQAIAFQFNKDIENVKNALNDGLNDMTSMETLNRGFADFSKVSLAWNKLVARVNPYIKGQQTDPDFQAATAGDYNYVRQKLKDDLLQFFQNAIQQINSFKQGLGQQGQVPTVQNEASLQDIVQQLSTGFYKNVRYGAEERSSLFIPRLPPNVVQQGQQGQQGQQPPPPPPAQPAPAPAQQAQYDAQQFPQEAAEGNVDNALLNQAINPYVAAQGEAQQMALARQQELDGINARMVADINAFERQNGYINNPLIDPADVLNAFVDDTRDELQQFYQLQDDDDIDGFLAGIVDELGDYRRGVGRYAQQGQPAPAPQQGQPAPAPQQRQGQPTPPRRPGRPAQDQMTIANKIDELGLRQQLTGYAGKTKAQKRAVAAQVQQVADALRVSSTVIKNNLNQMVGFGMKGGFLGGLIADGLAGMAGDAYRGATGKSFGSDLLSLGKMAFNNRGAIGDALKQKFMSLGKGASSRGHPLRLNNDFTGTSVVPNTLAELKNRLRVSKHGDYVGDSTGAIIPNLQNRGVLGSGRRSRRMEGEGVAEVLASIGDMSRRTFYAILLPALRALGRAVVSGVQLGKQLPPAVRDVFMRARGVYRREDVQTILSYLRDHPDVLIPFLPTPYAVSAVVLRLIQYWFNLPPSQQAPPAAQQGQQGQQGQAPLAPQQGNINIAPNLPPPLQLDPEDEDEGYVGVGNSGNGRCCFNSGMCRGTKAYRFNYGQKSANVRKESVRGRGGSAPTEMLGGGNGVNVNIKYSKLPKALQPTEEDLNPTPRPRSVSGGVRRRRMPKESYEGFQDEENDVYTHRGGIKEASPLVHSEMLQDKALGLLKGLPRRLGVEDPKFKPKK
jgi:hypothetical protein